MKVTARLKRVKWGLYDTRDKIFWGTDDGPIGYTSYMIARVASQTVDVQLGNKPGRTRVVVLPPGPYNYKGDAETLLSPEKALRLLEEGLV